MTALHGEQNILYIAKITKIGTSHYVIVPSYIMKTLGLRKGDKVIITIKKAGEEK